MLRQSALAIGLSAALFASAAHAEPPYPTVDFQGDWVLSDGKGMDVRATMHYSAANRKMRINMKQQGMAMSSVRDMASGDMILWSDQMPGMAMRVPNIDANDFDGTPTDEKKTVNGEDCTVWEMKQALACLTADNIPIEVTGEGFGSGLENLQRTEQDPAVFEVPSGLNVMDMPAGMPGAPNPGQGLPF
ncbi:hypothetical protein [Microbaculum sp. FT89]|uniref:hypothetical protein n=1 Tax=Microbaculum sp. FT89 TaxID=3447298 RepID=UPI003F538423